MFKPRQNIKWKKQKLGETKNNQKQIYSSHIHRIKPFWSFTALQRTKEVYLTYRVCCTPCPADYYLTKKGLSKTESFMVSFFFKGEAFYTPKKIWEDR